MRRPLSSLRRRRARADALRRLGGAWIFVPRSLLLASLLVALTPFHASALKVVVDNVDHSSASFEPTFGTVDIYLELEGGDGGLPKLGGWQVAITLDAPGSGISFISPFAEATDPYAHPPLSGDTITPDFASDNDGGRASAIAVLSVSGETIVNGAGLFRVPFKADAGANGVFTISLDPDEFAGTYLVDPSAVEIPVTLTGGSITVVQVIPTLPAWGAPLLGSVFGGAGAWVLARRRARS